MMDRTNKPSKVTILLLGGFCAYLIFAAVMMTVYEPQPGQKDWDDRQAYNLQQLSHIKLGQTLDEIVTLMGEADFVEAKTFDGKTLQIMFYRTHHIKGDGITTKDECTPLLFDDEKLIAFGQDTFEQYVNASPRENAHVIERAAENSQRLAEVNSKVN
jgi:hypothetical protein